MSGQKPDIRNFLYAILLAMKHYLLSALSVLAFFVFLPSTATAQTAPTISYQGELQNNGSAVNGTDTMKILIYDVETGGTPLYSETQSVNVANGIFNVAIGSVTPLLPTLDFTKQYYLAVSVNGGSELSPRALVSFAPYAFRALNSDTASYASSAARATIANGLSGPFVTSLNGFSGTFTVAGNDGITISNTVSNNLPILTIGSTGVQSVNTAGGKVTLVGTGGTTIADTGTTITIHSQTFTGGTGIQAVQNSDNTLTISNGNGPTATINLARQNASLGQVLSWSGSAWQPITLPSGNQPDSIKDLGDARVIPGSAPGYYLGDNAGVNSTVGGNNVGVGNYAMHSTTIGGYDVAVGGAALTHNTTGSYNVAVGVAALSFNTIGGYNVAVGANAMASLADDSAYGNTACGAYTLASLYYGSTFNTAVGLNAASGCGSGSSNVAVGVAALNQNIASSFLVAIGDSALFNNGVGTVPQVLDSATCNTAVGSKSLVTNTNGSYNTATGFHSLYNNLNGYHNTALGNLALYQNVTGNYNTALGDNSGPTNAALSNTTTVGSGATATASNEVVIGNGNVTSLYCMGAYAATTANSANMVVTSTGQIMRSTSSARYKTNIHDLDINTDKLYDLRPVSYTSKIDGKEYFGLVAEDVARVLPDLAEYAKSKDVIPGSNSDALIPDAVKYPMLSVLLLEELKKEHAKVETEEQQFEAQQKINADMERRLDALEALQKSTR